MYIMQRFDKIRMDRMFVVALIETQLMYIMQRFDKILIDRMFVALMGFNPKPTHTLLLPLVPMGS
jgi:hypothetical protein